jgi:hypothetical protein
VTTGGTAVGGGASVTVGKGVGAEVGIAVGVAALVQARASNPMTTKTTVMGLVPIGVKSFMSRLLLGPGIPSFVRI